MSKQRLYLYNKSSACPVCHSPHLTTRGSDLVNYWLSQDNLVCSSCKSKLRVKMIYRPLDGAQYDCLLFQGNSGL